MSETIYEDRAWSVLRLVYGVVPVVAGLDKFTNILTQWDHYLNPSLAHLLPVPASLFMNVVGVIEIAVGLAILTRWTKLAAFVAAAWLTLIALNIASTGAAFDVAVRDLVMAAGAYALGQLTQARETSPAWSGASQVRGGDARPQSA